MAEKILRTLIELWCEQNGLVLEKLEVEENDDHMERQAVHIPGV